MADFPNKQILSDEFFYHGYLRVWHFTKAPTFPQPTVELREAARNEIRIFIREESKGRFFIDRTSRPGYWFEEPVDAMLYKLRFL